MDSAPLSGDERAALEGLAGDLRRVFAGRLLSLVAYGLDRPAPPPRLLHLALWRLPARSWQTPLLFPRQRPILTRTGSE